MKVSVNVKRLIDSPFKSRESTLLFFYFLIGMILLILSSLIYDKTLIQWYIPLGCIIITTILVSLFNSVYLQKYFGLSGIFLRLVYNLLSTGGVLIYILMALNFYFAHPEESTHHLDIVDKGTSYYKSKKRIYALVRLKGITKEIYFNPDLNLSAFSRINVTVRKGLLGYDIIIKKQLEN
jgi:hypothetical protein